MLEVLKKLGKHLSVYGLGMLLSRAISFLMIPVYTHYLTPADYGVLELLDLTTYVLGIFMLLGVSSAVFKFYVEYDNDRDKAQVISTAATFVVLLSLALISIAEWKRAFISRLVFGGSEYSSFYTVALASFLFSTWTEVPMAFLRAQQKSVNFLAISLARLVCGLGLNIYFIVVLHKGVWGILLSNFIASIVFAIGLCIDTYRVAGMHFSLEKLKKLLSFGVPLLPSSVGMFVLVFSDRFFLKHFSTLDEVGIYSLAYKFGMGLAVLLNSPFLLAWQPQVFELGKRPDAPRVYSRLTSIYVFISLTLALVVIVGADAFIRVGTPRSYWKAASIVPFIVIAYVFDGVKGFFQIGMLLKNQTKYIGFATFGTAIANIILNYLLIPRYHAYGAAIATLSCYVILACALYPFSQRLYHIPFAVGKMIKLLLVFTVAAILSITLRAASPVVDIGLKLLVFLCFLAISWFSGFFEPKDKQSLIEEVSSAWDGWRRRKQTVAS
ncbi:MAG: oligosaccharide flippase family protein [Acidobacteriaceae bacterium]